MGWVIQGAIRILRVSRGELGILQLELLLWRMPASCDNVLHGTSWLVAGTFEVICKQGKTLDVLDLEGMIPIMRLTNKNDEARGTHRTNHIEGGSWRINRSGWENCIWQEMKSWKKEQVMIWNIWEAVPCINILIINEDETYPPSCLFSFQGSG